MQVMETSHDMSLPDDAAPWWVLQFGRGTTVVGAVIRCAMHEGRRPAHCGRCSAELIDALHGAAMVSYLALKLAV